MTVAKIIFMCRKCSKFSETPINCPTCGVPMETTAVINAYELGQLIKKLATPEGITIILNLLDKFLKGEPLTK